MSAFPLEHSQRVADLARALRGGRKRQLEVAANPGHGPIVQVVGGEGVACDLGNCRLVAGPLTDQLPPAGLGLIRPLEIDQIPQRQGDRVRRWLDAGRAQLVERALRDLEGCCGRALHRQRGGHRQPQIGDAPGMRCDQRMAESVAQPVQGIIGRQAVGSASQLEQGLVELRAHEFREVRIGIVREILVHLSQPVEQAHQLRGRVVERRLVIVVEQRQAQVPRRRHRCGQPAAVVRVDLHPPQHFLYLTPLPHQQGLFRPGGHSIASPVMPRDAA